MPLTVAQRYEAVDLRAAKVLDLCSGCGVIGFEFHFYKSEIAELHFIEVQKDKYLEHFEKNLTLIKPTATKFQSYWMNYAQLLEKKFANTYDLVLANPPYFEADQGKLSPSEFKNRCRFFLDSNFETFLEVIFHTLMPGASAYILLRSLSEHKKDLKSKLEAQLGARTKIQEVTSIRGTDLVQIQKNI